MLVILFGIITLFIEEPLNPFSAITVTGKFSYVAGITILLAVEQKNPQYPLFLPFLISDGLPSSVDIRYVLPIR